MKLFARWVKYLASVLIYYSGLFWVLRFVRKWRRGGRVVVLTYHSFSETMNYLNMAVPASLFLRQIQYLQNTFRAQTLSGWLNSRDENQMFSDDVVIITVDDGYADNYEPLLAAADRGVPSTLFVTTGCIDTTEPTSVWMVMLAIHHASPDSIDLQNEGLGILKINTVVDKDEAIRRIDAYMKPLSNQRRCEVLEQLLNKADNREAVQHLAREAMLDWGQIKVLHSRGVEIGAHSITHPILSRWDAETVSREVVGSIQRLTQQVGMGEVTFAYPYGSEYEVSGEVVDICKRSGARAAVMLVSGDLKHCDEFRIPRKMVTVDLSTSPWGSYSRALWACELEGVLDPLKNAYAVLKVLWRAKSLVHLGITVKAPVPITYLLDTYETPRGGTENQILQLITRIDRSRYLPSVAMLRSSDWVETNSMGCRLTVLGVWKLTSLATLTKLLRLGWNLRKERCRIVHCYFNDVSLIAPVILSLYGLRIIVSRRDMGIWYSPFKLFLLRLNARFVDCYVANSKAVKKVVQQCEWVGEDRIRVIYNGYSSQPSEEAKSSELLRELSLEGAGPIVGVVANVRKVKRLDTVIRAFSLISRQYSNLSVVFVGDVHHDQAQEEMLKLGQLIADLGLDHRVKFTGAVDEPRQYIHMFSVAVLCSESEGLSNSLIEYMQAGRPIVCTDVGGNSELIRDGDNGFLIKVDEWKALADRISLILSDCELARRIGDRARETVRAMISDERMVMEQMTCYEQVLSRHAALANSVSLT